MEGCSNWVVLVYYGRFLVLHNCRYIHSKLGQPKYAFLSLTGLFILLFCFRCFSVIYIIPVLGKYALSVFTMNQTK